MISKIQLSLILSFFVLALAFTISGCTAQNVFDTEPLPDTGETSTPVSTPTSEAAAAMETPTTAAPATPSSGQLLENEEAGYSFEYPEGYEVRVVDPDNVTIFAPAETEGHRERAFINVEDANGRTVEQVVEDVRQPFPDMNLEASTITIDTKQAMVVSKVPGQDLNRLVLIVHEDRLYRLMFVPDDETRGEDYQQMENLYATVTDTFRFIPVVRDTAVTHMEDFEARLYQALSERDMARLEAMMTDPFAIGYWQGEGVTHTPATALQVLDPYISSAYRLTFERQADLPGLLGGMNPLTVLGPAVTTERALLVSGLGEQGRDQGILFIGRNNRGELTWQGILVAMEGFAGLGVPPASGLGEATDVKTIMANVDLNIYNGPGSQYAVIGDVFSGMMAQVTGISADGNWWRVICPDDTVGECWVSADPRQAQPVK